MSEIKPKPSISQDSLMEFQKDPPTSPERSSPAQSWTKRVKIALLHAIFLAAMALTVARSRVATSRSRSPCLQAELHRAHTGIALL